MVMFMRGKIFVLILVFVFLIASGCSGKDTPSTPKDNNASAPQAGLTEQKGNAVAAPEVHIIRLRFPPQYGFVPSKLDIKTGDIISWWSEKKQKPDYVLVSKEGLFPETALDYSVPVNYTFDKQGNYSFNVKDIPDMNVTITVK
jgi:plastocyanin